MIDRTFVELSPWQFAATALCHFLFVPLTLRLSWLLIIMDTVHVMSGKEIYKGPCVLMSWSLAASQKPGTSA